MAKQTHQKELFEYNTSDHFKMAMWHLRRCGISNPCFENLEKIITHDREQDIIQTNRYNNGTNS